MRLIIVSGLSGSGKSVALHVLEDLGYYCIDNLPAALLKSVVEEVDSGSDEKDGLLAVGVDARNRQDDLESLPQLIDEMRQRDIQTELLFLQSSDDVLLKRYAESRRRHPLAVRAKGRQTHVSFSGQGVESLVHPVSVAPRTRPDRTRTAAAGMRV